MRTIAGTGNCCECEFFDEIVVDLTLFDISSRFGKAVPAVLAGTGFFGSIILGTTATTGAVTGAIAIFFLKLVLVNLWDAASRSSIANSSSRFSEVLSLCLLDFLTVAMGLIVSSPSFDTALAANVSDRAISEVGLVMLLLKAVVIL